MTDGALGGRLVRRFLRTIRDDASGERFKYLLGIAVTISGCVYLSWRTTVFNPQAPAVSALFFGVELLGFAASLIVFFVAIHPRRRETRPAPRGLAVDVFVTTLNEEIAVVRRTLVAATRISYPHTTWLLDDGDRAQFRDLARELGCRYLARAGSRGAKAGNVNHALRHATGAYVALFDADHCPQPDFLDRLLGYFDDPAVAFVQTPQDYYNPGSFQHAFERSSASIWHEQSSFHHVLQPGRDYHGATTLCGCSCILRREHLDLIGGFPEETVTEDMHAAVRLQKQKLKTVYHDEPLAYGIAPTDFRDFIRQRLRWGEGNMQVCRLEGVPFTRSLTLRQNLCYVLLAIAYADSWRKMVLYVAPPLTLIFETPPVYGKPGDFVLFFLPYLALSILAYSEIFGGFGRIAFTEVFDMARLSPGLASAWGLFRRDIRFRVSSKRLTGRLSALLTLPQVAIALLSTYAIALAMMRWAEIAIGRRGVVTEIWIEAVLALFCAANLALAVAVLRLAMRSSRLDERNFSHVLELPIRQVDGHAGPWKWTRALSLDSAYFDGPAFPSGRLSLEVLLPDGSLRIDGRHASDGAASGRVDFLWESVVARDRLDQLLHAGRWHRVLAGRSEAGLTFLERLGWRKPPAWRLPSASMRWRPIVLTRLNGDATLGYLRDGELIHFLRRPEPLFLAAGTAQDGAAVIVDAAARAPMMDEAALAPLGAVRQAVRFEVSTTAAAAAN